MSVANILLVLAAAVVLLAVAVVCLAMAVTRFAKGQSLAERQAETNSDRVPVTADDRTWYPTRARRNPGEYPTENGQ